MPWGFSSHKILIGLFHPVFPRPLVDSVFTEKKGGISHTHTPNWSAVLFLMSKTHTFAYEHTQANSSSTYYGYYSHTHMSRRYRQMPHSERSYIFKHSHDCRNVNKSTVGKMLASGHSGGRRGEKGAEGVGDQRKERGSPKGWVKSPRLCSTPSWMTLTWLCVQLLNDKYPGEPIHLLLLALRAAAVVRNEEHLFYMTRANVSLEPDDHRWISLSPVCFKDKVLFERELNAPVSVKLHWFPVCWF